ncbi:hypothetical protein QNN00_14485 [Bacillus velezensis]|nr:hypothetical protein [Bacillus velezensis]
MKASVLPAEAKQDVTYTSSTQTVASVSSGASDSKNSGEYNDHCLFKTQDIREKVSNCYRYTTNCSGR